MVLHQAEGICWRRFLAHLNARDEIQASYESTGACVCMCVSSQVNNFNYFLTGFNDTQIKLSKYEGNVYIA